MSDSKICTWIIVVCAAAAAVLIFTAKAAKATPVIAEGPTWVFAIPVVFVVFVGVIGVIASRSWKKRNWQ